MGKYNVAAGQKPVFMHMQKHPGIVYTADSLADEMGLAKSDVPSVGRSFTSLCAKEQIERVGLGRYLYRKPPKELPPPSITKAVAGNVYEAIGLRKSTGNVIVMDSDNNLYELHEL